jgi:hypothetical protein
MSEQNLSLGRCVLTGSIAGIVGALLANLALLVLTTHFGQSFDQLNWFSITRASMISSVLGGFVYYALSCWTARPLVWFILLGLAVATLDSIFVWRHPPEPGFARIANPLHYVVTITAILFIPALAPVFPSETSKRSNPPPVPS